MSKFLISVSVFLVVCSISATGFAFGYSFQNDMWKIGGGIPPSGRCSGPTQQEGRIPEQFGEGILNERIVAETYVYSEPITIFDKIGNIVTNGPAAVEKVGVVDARNGWVCIAENAEDGDLVQQWIPSGPTDYRNPINNSDGSQSLKLLKPTFVYFYNKTERGEFNPPRPLTDEAGNYVSVGVDLDVDVYEGSSTHGWKSLQPDGSQYIPSSCAQPLTIICPPVPSFSGVDDVRLSGWINANQDSVNKGAGAVIEVAGHPISGAFLRVWSESPSELGEPVGKEENGFQEFKNGTLVKSEKTFVDQIAGKIDLGTFRIQSGELIDQLVDRVEASAQDAGRSLSDASKELLRKVDSILLQNSDEDTSVLISVTLASGIVGGILVAAGPEAWPAAGVCFAVTAAGGTILFRQSQLELIETGMN